MRPTQGAHSQRSRAPENQRHRTAHPARGRPSQIRAPDSLQPPDTQQEIRKRHLCGYRSPVVYCGVLVMIKLRVDVHLITHDDSYGA